MNSVWMQTAELPKFPPLERDLNTDVLIVGGGIVGLLCTYFLRQVGVDCVLLEAKELCGGVTGNTTAKITTQHELIYDNCCVLSGRRWPACTWRPTRRRWVSGY